MIRTDNRTADQLRPVSFDVDFIKYAEGSVLISAGNTRVLCNVSIEDGVPPWMVSQNVNGGWITAEYSMLPRSTHTRSRRENKGPRGRSQEIQRLIGRSLRAAIDLELLGPRTCFVDCDVLQADGGTRTASITGGYVALAIALKRMINEGALPEAVFQSPVAAISCGIVKDQELLDLCYTEDVEADVDANFVMNHDGNIIEIQGTAEGEPFPPDQFLKLLDLAKAGIGQLLDMQAALVEKHGRPG